MLTRGHEILPLCLESKGSSYVIYGSFNTRVLSWEKWLKGRHPRTRLAMEWELLTRWESTCALIKWSMNKKLMLGLLINETVNWYHYSVVKVFSCLIKIIEPVVCYSLLLVSYTMILISFAKPWSSESVLM